MTPGTLAVTQRAPWWGTVVCGFRRHVWPWLPRVTGLVVVAVIGASVGAALAPSTSTTVGPLLAEVRVVPSLDPGVQVLLPPAGEVRFATHRAPIAVQARVSQVDADDARRLLESPAGLDALARDAPDTLRRATLRAAAVTAGCALLGALLLALLAYRRAWRRTADVAGIVTATLLVTSGLVAVTFDADRLAQPRFTGLLSQAPYVARGAPSLLARLESYRSGLADIVQSVTTLYATSGTLPVLPGRGSQDLITVLHVSDIHLNPLAFDLIDKLVAQFDVNVVVDSGDITTWGTELESRVISRVGAVGVPYVFVRGNHDSVRTQAAVARNSNVVVLNGTVKEVAGIVMAGIGDPVFTPNNPADAPSSPSSTPAAPPTSSQPASAGPSEGGGVTPAGSERTVQERSNLSLAQTIRTWNAAHPDRPVQLADVHEPVGLEPLIGVTPLIMAGHAHKREVSEQSVELDGRKLTSRVMVQGSTGGAGITSSGLRRLGDGSPLPLAATLVYVARSGERAGQVVAYDEVTVGGFGLASVSLNRQVLRADPRAAAAGEHSPGG